MTATITELFPETWEEKVKRLARSVKQLRHEYDPVNATPNQRQEWRIANLELVRVLDEVPE